MENQSNTSSVITRRRSLQALGAGVAALSVAGWTRQALANTSGVPVPALPAMPKSDPAAYGRALATYAEQFDSGWVDQFSKSKMTLVDARGDRVTREVTQRILEGNQGDKSMVRFMRPAEIRGVAALVHEHPRGTDDNWLYLPSSRRTRRISGANRTASFQGTEFTYEDLSSFTVSRYDWRHLGDKTHAGQPVYQLEARPNYKDTGYSKLVVLLNQKHWRPEQIEYYDLAGRHLKTYSSSAWKAFHGRFHRAMRIEMKNHQTGKSTILESQAMLLNLSLYQKQDGSARSGFSPSNFTKRALENG